MLASRVRGLADKRLTELKDAVGFNLAALRFVENQAMERERVESFVEATSKFKAKRKKRKQKQRAMQAAIMSIWNIHHDVHVQKRWFFPIISSYYTGFFLVHFAKNAGPKKKL